MRPIVTALLTMAIAACGGDGKAKPSAVNAAEVAAAKTATATDARVQRADLARIRGDSSAKVWLVIASDFQCPWCKMWHDSTAGIIDREYVATGKIRVAYLNFPLRIHPNSRPSAEAAMCGGAQGKFWEFHDALFDTQAKWAAETDPGATFEGIATKLGLDVAAWKACTNEHVMAAMVQADLDRGVAGNVGSTPTFFVGDEVIASAAGISVFRPAIERALAKATATAK